IVVMPFEVLGAGETDPVGLGRMFAEGVSVDLRGPKSPPVRPVPTQSPGVEAGDACAIARRNMAGRVITGTLERDGGSLRATFRLQDTLSGEVSWTKALAMEAEVNRFASALAREVL